PIVVHRWWRDLFPVSGDGGVGEPCVTLICWVQAEGATAITAAASIPPRRICLVDFIGVNLVCCRSSDSSEIRGNLAGPTVTCLENFRAMAGETRYNVYVVKSLRR